MRTCLTLYLTGALLCGGALRASAWQAAQYDVLLKGGHVIDPQNNLNAPRDVAVREGRIAAVQPDIPASAARQVIDVGGYYVTPGLIDIHVHVNWTEPNNSLKPEDRTLASGVTTIVDAGSVGWQGFPRFKAMVVDAAREVRVLALLNVCGPGMGPVEQDPKNYHPEMTAATIKQYRDILVGVKAAHYWDTEPFDAEHPPWASVDAGVRAGTLADVPVMLDFWPRPPERSYEDLILKHLRPGDIHTHVTGQHIPVILEDGTLNPAMQRARDRGIIFDVGHGSASFWFRNAARAVELGFYPTTISTDLHGGMAEYSMLDVMSKFLVMGMPLDEVIKRSTLAPAQAIRRSDLGTLSVGAGADIAVLELRHGQFGYGDRGTIQGPDFKPWQGDRKRTRMVGDRKLESRLTVFKGRIVYDPDWRQLPDWRDTPRPW